MEKNILDYYRGYGVGDSESGGVDVYERKDKIWSIINHSDDLVSAFTYIDYIKPKKKRVKKIKRGYIRIGKYEINEVLGFVGPYKKSYMGEDENGKIISAKVKMGSQRYELFKNKGVVCVICGLAGEFFYLEKQGESYGDHEFSSYHFNLYGYNEKGEEVMLTKDHIFPKSKGGANELENYQTMCTVCNSNKGNNLE